jgi:hypothetical protein
LYEQKASDISKSTINCTALLVVLLFGIVLTLKSLGACADTTVQRVVCFTSHFTPIMASVQQKAQCVFWYAEFKSIVTVQRYFRRTYGEDPLTEKNIVRWHNQFKETINVNLKKSSSQPRTSKENVKRLRQSCLRNLKKSIARRSLELGIPKTTIQNMLHKRLRLLAYKIQLRHEIKEADRLKHVGFSVTMLNAIDDESYLNRIFFSDEATLHINGCVNRHNCRIWESQQPNEVFQFVRGSPKVNVWCGLTYDRVVGPFMFVENTITGDSYLDMLEHSCFSPNL